MDQDLVVRAQEGDRRAFDTLTVTDYPRLFRVAHSILRDRSQAEDATQHYACDLVATDPRFVGTEEIDLIAYITSGSGGPWTAEAVLTTDEGSWRGTAQGVYDTARSFEYGKVTYLGEGAYEGLTAHDYFAGQGDPYSLTGWITSSE